eukprot:1158845-Pelagomonas_calceolata.AAC.4
MPASDHSTLVFPVTSSVFLNSPQEAGMLARLGCKAVSGLALLFPNLRMAKHNHGDVKLHTHTPFYSRDHNSVTRADAGAGVLQGEYVLAPAVPAAALQSPAMLARCVAGTAGWGPCFWRCLLLLLRPRAWQPLQPLRFLHHRPTALPTSAAGSYELHAHGCGLWCPIHGAQAAAGAVAGLPSTSLLAVPAAAVTVTDAGGLDQGSTETQGCFAASQKRVAIPNDFDLSCTVWSSPGLQRQASTQDACCAERTVNTTQEPTPFTFC